MMNFWHMQRYALGFSLISLITACSPDTIELAGSGSASGKQDAKIAQRGNISTGAVRPGEQNPELDSTTELLGSDSRSGRDASSHAGENIRLPENVSGAFLVGCSSIVPADGSVPMVTCGVDSDDGSVTILSLSSIRVKASDANAEEDDDASSWVSVDMNESNHSESSVSFPMAIELLEDTKIEVRAEVRIVNPAGKQIIRDMVIKRKSKNKGGSPKPANPGQYKKADFAKGSLGDLG